MLIPKKIEWKLGKDRKITTQSHRWPKLLRRAIKEVKKAQETILKHKNIQ